MNRGDYMLTYKKEDKVRRMIVMIVGIILAILITIGIITSSGGQIILKALLAFFVNVVLLVLLQYFFVLKRSQKRINTLLQSGLVTLNYDPLREEMKLINEAYDRNPKKMRFYSIPLFSAYRIMEGEAAGKFIDPVKTLLKKMKKNELLKANFTVELCYYYLTINDIEMFLLAVKKLESYHYTIFEKLARKFQKITDNVNPNEYKELSLISGLYTNGVNEETIEQLLNNSMTFYRMIYTYFILNFYKSMNDENKVQEYTLLLEQFEGNAYPLRRTDLNEI